MSFSNIVQLDYSYDSDLSIWLSVDPMSDSRSWVSPYSYCQNNPVGRVDPTGALDNPIYDYIGKFLGTDDKGLKGEPILMDESNFTQGMSHEEATQKGTMYNNLNDDGKELFKLGGGEKHYLSLNTRPDWDGFVTIDEGVQWAKDHPGALNNITPYNTLYLDASKLNFGSMKSSDLAEGQIVSINIFDYTNFSSNSSRHTSYALGNTRMKLLNGTTGQVQLFSDNYDWDYHQAGYVHSNTSPPNSTRDRLVWGDRILKGLNDSHGFRVNIYGVGTLNK